MRPKRTKACRKEMQFYQQNYGFREPYQILVSPDFVLEGVAKNIDVPNALEEIVCGKARLLTTFCGITEVRKDSEHRARAIEVTRGFEKRRCPHKEPISGPACISEIIGDDNKHHYCVAVHDGDLRTKLRRVPGVPIIGIKHGLVVLEHLSSEKKKAGMDQLLHQKIGVSMQERQLLKDLKAGDAKAKVNGPKKHKKKKGPKGPNPLSVKKSKKKGPAGAKRPRSEAQDSATDGGSKRQRSKE
ncbi:hypothetical protein GGF46_003914 [Coemansia sp. RSA 552]|nr:hypothetical protein GGF46_003914 [Coemansia sp. RSA 552]